MKIHFVKALKDNYVYILESDGTKDVIVIDPSESQPVIDFCKENDFQPTHILNTHHHWDHVDGNKELQQKFQCEVYGYAGDKNRIPAISKELKDGENFQIHRWQLKVIHIPGHTTGQIAFYNKPQKAVFVGDTLFRFGCGRLFEGTPETMFSSLKKIASLPEDTNIYCGHEYAERNLEFSAEHNLLEADKQNEMESRVQKELAQKQRAVPFTVKEQKNYSPFLTAKNTTEFAKIRGLRDVF